MKVASILPRLLSQRERGFAAITGIFLVVALAALGGFILSVSTQQQIGSALDVQGVRAYQAARSGLEWGMYQVQATSAYNFSYGSPATAVGAVGPNARACTGASGSFVPAATTLAGFTVTVACDQSVPAIAGEPLVYTVTATACNQPASGACPNMTNPGGNYIERRLVVSF